MVRSNEQQRTGRSRARPGPVPPWDRRPLAEPPGRSSSPPAPRPAPTQTRGPNEAETEARHSRPRDLAPREAPPHRIPASPASARPRERPAWDWSPVQVRDPEPAATDLAVGSGVARRYGAAAGSLKSGMTSGRDRAADQDGMPAARRQAPGRSSARRRPFEDRSRRATRSPEPGLVKPTPVPGFGGEAGAGVAQVPARAKTKPKPKPLAGAQPPRSGGTPGGAESDPSHYRPRAAFHPRGDQRPLAPGPG